MSTPPPFSNLSSPVDSKSEFFYWYIQLELEALRPKFIFHTESIIDVAFLVCNPVVVRNVLKSRRKIWTHLFADTHNSIVTQYKEKHAKMFHSGGSDVFFAGGIYIILSDLFTLWIWIADASSSPCALPEGHLTSPQLQKDSPTINASDGYQIIYSWSSLPGKAWISYSVVGLVDPRSEDQISVPRAV